MDTSSIITIVIAITAIFPGIWSLINLEKRTKIEQEIEMKMVMETRQMTMGNEIEKLFNQMQKQEPKQDVYKIPVEKSVVIRCVYCNSRNTSGSPTCTQCGAPLGIEND